MALDPIVEQMLTQMAEAGGPTLAEMTLADARAMYRMMGENFSRPQMDSIEDTTANGVSVRIYRPSAADKLPCLVYFHGGGWVIGDLESHDNVCRTLADQIGCVVIATDYRLSPEHPFPAPLDDCYTVTRWAADNADALNIDAAKIAVGGDSAGGNLSACVALRIKQEGGPALVHQLLMCPVTDAAMDTASYSENAEGYMLTRDTMTWFFGHYLGDTDSKNPYISPLHAEDLSGLPPATVITAQYDPLRDEGEAYAGRLKAAGV
ncbi:MAG TPA: alpha/beta hydrolase, partial [Pseudomonadales bacterium]|nr:alpha/beta hydrolase [Pseudomonadales bacterium]